MRVSLLVTCLIDLFEPDTGVDVVKVLRAAGCEVACPEGQTCYTAISTDFADVSGSAPIPEPGTLILLGGGLLGLARARKRKA